MKQFGVILAAMLFAVSSAFADGTKQLMPNAGTEASPSPMGNCYLSLAAQEGGSSSGNPSRNFARYYYDAGTGTDVSCDTSNALYINIKDPENEVIHFGFGNAIEVTHTSEAYYKNDEVSVRIKDPCGNVVWPVDGSGNVVEAGYTLAYLKSHYSVGNITSYAKAYYGPKSVNTNGYDYFSIKPNTSNCDMASKKNRYRNYRIEFNTGEPLSKARITQIYLDYFDVSVVNTEDEGCTVDANGKVTSGTGKLEEGRIWSYAWGLNTNASSAKTYTSFYTMSTDFFVSKVYLNGFEPYQFVVACNSFGSENTRNCEEDRKSQRPDVAPYDQIPEYQVFLTQPDAEYWGDPKIPNVPDKLTFAGDAMTCEDLIFVVKLLYNENATLELYMDTDQDGITDKVIAALLQANIIRNRGFHYPWKDRTQLQDTCSTCDTSWHGEGIGWGKYYYNPAADGCARRYTLSLFDQSYSYPYVKMVNDAPFPTTDRVNPGDSLQAVPKYENEEYTFLNTTTKSYERITMTYPIGSEKNPVLIEDADDLELLQAAVNKGISFDKCIKDFYHYWEGGVENFGDYCYTIPNTNGDPVYGDNEGFRNTYFYIVAPTGTIVSDDDWDGIGTYSDDPEKMYDRPFRGHIRAGRYMPNPTVDNLSATTASLAGDQDTIIINGTNGLFAYCDGATIENIHVKGTVSGAKGTYQTEEEETWGGLGGVCDYAVNTSFSHCSNACSVTASSSTYPISVGGIVGYGINCSIDSCSNYASIINDNNKSEGTGGIAGYLDGETVDFCYNVGNIEGPENVGGIIGYVDFFDSDNFTAMYCKNEGYVESSKGAGGIIGGGTNKSGCSLNIISCYNKGTVSGETDNNTGGIMGAQDHTNSIGCTFSYCLNEGNAGEYGIVPNASNTFIHCVSTKEYEEYYNGEGSRISNVDHWENVVTQLDNENKTTIYNSIIAFDSNDDVVDDDSPFYLDADGNLQMFATECCGRTFHQEDAGRLFNSNTTFYIKWDGKDSEGECVTGDVTVSYQKNSGVTHFPFYDPENNIADRGLVVYRISPIQDTITKVGSDGYTPTAYQAANGITDPSYYGYSNLPKNYYGSGETIPDEKGIELKLFWDDTKISLDGECSNEKIKKSEEAGYYRFGETKTSVATYEDLCTGYSVTEKVWNAKKRRYENKTIDICESSLYKKTTAGVKHCTKIKSGYTCQKWQRVKTSSETSKCFGISNLGSSDVWFSDPNSSKADKTGGYYGSTAGGHLFPKSNFGDKNTMNTWWNGVEVKQLVPLKLTAYEPAVLMPIEMTMWTATSLEESVLLEWTTASEENNDYFAIERSIDGVTWKVLGNVGGAGTTSATHYYSFEDTKPVSGISYYRLKQVDFNGEYTYSSVKCINRPANADKMYKAYVNKDIDAFIVQGEEIAACNIEVYNNLGVKMTNLSFNPISTDKVVINVGQLPIGTYFIKICNGSKSVVKSW